MDFTESVSNLYEAFKHFLTVCVFVVSNKRSFLKLKLIKTYLRSTMSQIRLNGLVIRSVKKEAANKVNFEADIVEFARAKVWRQRVL